MNKVTNRFVSGLFIFYILAQFGIEYLIQATGVELPLWLAFTLGEILMLVPAALYMIIRKINPLRSFPLRRLKPGDAVLALLLGYCTFPVVAVVNYISMFFSTNYVAQSVDSLQTVPFWEQLLLVAVIPPLVEEFVFRGLLYHSYRKNGILGAAMISTLLFALAHLNLNQFCYVLVLGMVLALVVEGTASLETSVLVHFAINSVSVFVLAIQNVLQQAGSTVVSAQEEAAGLDQFTASQRAGGLVSLVVFAVPFVFLSFAIFKKLCVRSGRWNYLKRELSAGAHSRHFVHVLPDPSGKEPQTALQGQNWMSFPLYVVIVGAFVYMVLRQVLKM